MDQNERLLQAIGTAFLVLFGGLLIAIRYIARLQVGWRDALLLAGLNYLVVAVVRICSSLGLLEQADGRTVNGLVASVFVAALVVSIWGHWKMRVIA